MYDVVIIGAGAAGLFTGIHLPKKMKKVILEKNAKPGVKVLLSGGERANISNVDIEPERDYFGQNKKALRSIFKRYNQWDIQSFFAENQIEIVEEDRGRLILKSGDSKELLGLLVKKTKENNCELTCESDVKKILRKENSFEVQTLDGKRYIGKNIVVSSGGKSFFQVGTTGEGYNFAEELGVNIIPPNRALGGVSTKKDLSEISGVSCDIEASLFDNNQKDSIYSEFGPLLFTHFGVSGPIIFNLGNAIGEHLNHLKIEESEFEKYILENMSLTLTFSDLEKIPKRVVKFFELDEEKKQITLELQNWRSWKEAKATGGGIDIDELDKYMQTKKIPGLFFIGEVVDITGKTGGFNLQWAWSSAFVASEWFVEK